MLVACASLYAVSGAGGSTIISSHHLLSSQCVGCDRGLSHKVQALLIVQRFFLLLLFFKNERMTTLASNSEN